MVVPSNCYSPESPQGALRAEVTSLCLCIQAVPALPTASYVTLVFHQLKNGGILCVLWKMVLEIKMVHACMGTF